MMFNLIEHFPFQLKEAIKVAENAKLSPTITPVKNIIISGLGGSGIGGRIVSQLVESEATLPILVAQGYFLPGYVGPETLIIISSYSGNTEETISCLKEAIKKNAKIVCICSGGSIAEIAREQKLDLILIPGGNPPRACLGLSLTQLFYILSFHKIIGTSFKKQLEDAINLLIKEKEAIMLEAKALAVEIKDKTPVIYTSNSNEAVAIRFRQQINENSKILCWHHVFPELNHNELVGWSLKNEKLAVLIFRDQDDFERIQYRMEISKNIIRNYTSTILEIYTKGQSSIEKAIYLVHLGDWISYFLAEIKNTDSMEIEVIDKLKSELAKG
jgi:glucose/mannose-6-phosphate isomerase